MQVEQTLSHAILNQFNLLPHQIKSCDKYYILYWQGSYLNSLLLRGPRIVREGVTYQPVWINGANANYFHLNPTAQVKLSFRRIKHHSTGIVLISTVLGGRNS